MVLGRLRDAGANLPHRRQALSIVLRQQAQAIGVRDDHIGELRLEPEISLEQSLVTRNGLQPHVGVAALELRDVAVVDPHRLATPGARRRALDLHAMR